MSSYGSNDSLGDYIKKAIEEGIEEITFTEHMPMPKGIVLEGASSDFLENIISRNRRNKWIF